ncbi:hypothetical protein AtDm6_0517 [Acetobacter tropicalis]|uniref:Uncharacterized protein n=1 Tax=Acetobacter tropicalis TaxID=104102 RepID=A0A094YV94_9PROT|nr:hypothetical protein AtDm6_0517 [Acetobacter tropicalis]
MLLGKRAGAILMKQGHKMRNGLLHVTPEKPAGCMRTQGMGPLFFCI